MPLYVSNPKRKIKPLKQLNAALELSSTKKLRFIRQYILCPWDTTPFVQHPDKQGKRDRILRKQLKTKFFSRNLYIIHSSRHVFC